jgi:hypothetical protein
MKGLVDAWGLKKEGYLAKAQWRKADTNEGVKRLMTMEVCWISYK